MSNAASNARAAHLVALQGAPILDVMGPTIQFLRGPGDDGTPCIMRGTIPPGVIVPLHSHPDPEAFVMIAGELEALTYPIEGYKWVRIGPGDVFHVPGDARHAFRNRSREPAVSIIVSTSKLGRFFREVGMPVVPGAPPRPPSGETSRRFLETAARYGYWNATPQENARVGLFLPRFSCTVTAFGQAARR
jgi:quercetin dioxygenase-like cupin family protein